MTKTDIVYLRLSNSAQYQPHQALIGASLVVSGCADLTAGDVARLVNQTFIAAPYSTGPHKIHVKQLGRGRFVNLYRKQQ